MLVHIVVTGKKQWKKFQLESPWQVKSEILVYHFLQPYRGW